MTARAVTRAVVAGDITLRAVLDQLPSFVPRTWPAPIRALTLWGMAAVVGLSGRELALFAGLVDTTGMAVAEPVEGVATKFFVATTVITGFANVVTRGLPGVAALADHARGRAWVRSARVIRFVVPLVVVSGALILVMAPLYLDLLSPVLGLARSTIVAMTIPAGVLGLGLSSLVLAATGHALRGRAFRSTTLTQAAAHVSWAALATSLWFGAIELGEHLDRDVGLVLGQLPWGLAAVLVGVVAAPAGVLLARETSSGPAVPRAWSPWRPQGAFPVFRLALRRALRSADLRSGVSQAAVLTVLVIVGLRLVAVGNRDLLLGHAVVLMAVSLASPMLVMPSLVGSRPRLGLLTGSDSRHDSAVLLAVSAVGLVLAVLAAIAVGVVFGDSAAAVRLVLLWVAAAGVLLFLVADRMDGRPFDQSVLGLNLAGAYLGLAAAAIALGTAGLGEELIPVAVASVTVPVGILRWWSAVVRPRAHAGVAGTDLWERFAR